MSKLAYFMRATGRQGTQYKYQGVTPSLNYNMPIYFFFIVSNEAAEWIEEQSKSRNCYLLHDKLKDILDVNNVYYNGFIDDVESKQVLDISDKPMELVKPIVDCSELKSGEDVEVVDD